MERARTAKSKVRNATPPSAYESDELLAQYLLLHYGLPEQVLPFAFGPRDALDFPARVVDELLEGVALPPYAEALDLGCAVGRSTLELARRCRRATGLDLSERFIRTAQTLLDQGFFDFPVAEEGLIAPTLRFGRPAGVESARIRFMVGDAVAPPFTPASFDVVLLANLLDRVPDPARCLAHAADLLRPGGWLLVASPFTWMETHTPRERWLGAKENTPDAPRSDEGLAQLLHPRFELRRRKNMPFLIREHARKYQWGAADASAWQKRQAQTGLI